MSSPKSLSFLAWARGGCLPGEPTVTRVDPAQRTSAQAATSLCCPLYRRTTILFPNELPNLTGPLATRVSGARDKARLSGGTPQLLATVPVVRPDCQHQGRRQNDWESSCCVLIP